MSYPMLYLFLPICDSKMYKRALWRKSSLLRMRQKQQHPFSDIYKQIISRDVFYFSARWHIYSPNHDSPSCLCPCVWKVSNLECLYHFTYKLCLSPCSQVPKITNAYEELSSFQMLTLDKVISLHSTHY